MGMRRVGGGGGTKVKDGLLEMKGVLTCMYYSWGERKTSGIRFAD